MVVSILENPNYSKLERDLGISRNVLPNYMHLIDKSGLISLLPEKAKGLKQLEKIEKVYLQNPNIAYAFSPNTPDKGSLRESIFFAWMSVGHQITSSPVSDFESEGFTFEVGGRNKGRRQLSDVVPQNAYVVKDDIEHAVLHNIPLWMFGFLY